jgi:hypothetical protein
LDHEGGKLVGKEFMVGQIFEKLVKEKDETCTLGCRIFCEQFNQDVIWEIDP